MKHQEVIERFVNLSLENNPKIACIGDAIIDQYTDVEVKRINPEYPMPIMKKIGKDIFKLGGATNVVYQLKNFNCEKISGTFVDDNLISLLHKEKIDFISYSNSINEKPIIPVKIRHVNNSIQVAPRLDIEENKYGISQKQLKSISSSIIDNLLKTNADVVILSDYDKGFFDTDICYPELFEKSLTIVDPKRNPISRWKECTIFKPNYNEACELSNGITDVQEQALYFQKELQCECVVITLGKDGCYALIGNEVFETKSDKELQVKSVVGCGDCFSAYLALSMSYGMSIKEAIIVAQYACEIYVQKDSSEPLEILDFVNWKIVKPEILKNRNFQLSFTNGCFDILHSGHIQSLKFAKSQGEKLVVGLNSDLSIKKNKGENRPILNLKNRISVMESLEFVDFVVVFEEETPLEIIKKIEPDIIVKGGDYKKEEVCGKEYCKEVVINPMVEGVSTTSLIDEYIRKIQ